MGPAENKPAADPSVEVRIVWMARLGVDGVDVRVQATQMAVCVAAFGVHLHELHVAILEEDAGAALVVHAVRVEVLAYRA